MMRLVAPANKQPTNRIHSLFDHDVTIPEDAATFQACFKPLWVAMRVLGVFPIQYHKDGRAVFSVKSRAFVYALILFILIGCHTSFVISNQASTIQAFGGTFNSLIFSYMLIVYCSTYWLLPIGHWMGAARVAEYINMWHSFQIRSYQLTGVPLSLNARWKILSWTVAVPVLLVALVASEYLMLDLFSYWEGLYFIYIGVIVNYHYVLWYHICTALQQASTYLTETFSKEMLAQPSGLEVVPAYQDLWEDLSTLTKETGRALCYTFGAILLMTVAILTTSMYGCLSERDNQHGVSKALGLGMNSLIVLGLLYLLCNTASKTTTSVGCKFRDELKQLHVLNTEIQYQLDHFTMSVYLDSPCISLGGYVTVDNKLLLSLVATLISYLVILQQFDAEQARLKHVDPQNYSFHLNLSSTS